MASSQTIRGVSITGRAGLSDPNTSRIRGPVVPFVKQPKGYFESRGARDVVWSSILNILLTPRGTRLFLPEFGSLLPELVFEPNDDLLEGLAQRYIVDAVRRWEPRVSIQSVEINRDIRSGDSFHVTIGFVINTETETETRSFIVSQASVLSARN